MITGYDVIPGPHADGCAYHYRERTVMVTTDVNPHPAGDLPVILRPARPLLDRVWDYLGLAPIGKR